MSNHFTYEIDERNIRLQLKGHSLDVKEEDWQRFEALLSSGENSAQKVGGPNKLNITLNRNVVMPVVFGVIILAFSLLLVNFMSIKNPAKNATQSISSTDQPISPKTEHLAPVLKDQLQAPIENSIETKAPESALKAETNPTLEGQTVAETVKPSPAANPISVTNSSEPSQALVSGTSVVSETGTQEQTKKKRKKRLLESIESEQSSELRPTLVSEDRDAEVRPE